MKKTLTAVAAGLALTLTACGTNPEPAEGTPTPDTTTPTTASETSSPEPSTPEATTTVEATPDTPTAVPTTDPAPPASRSDEWGYAPYGYDEYGLPIVPDHATDHERCSMLAGMPCTDQMMAEWRAVNQHAEVQQERNAAHSWWGECIAVNTAEYCRANDPWQQ